MEASAKAVLDVLVPAWVASEVLLGVLLRARGARDRSTDRGSSVLLWAVILVSVACAVIAQGAAVGRAVGLPYLHAAALALMTLGLALRWWAIVTLGRLFTMTLAVRDEHRLVTRGPYRHIRHPAYAGMLLAFAGCGLWMESWLSAAVLVVPIGAVLLHRIRVEEAALGQALGEPYRRYCGATKRLVPRVF